MNELTFNSKVTTLVGEFGYLLPEFCLIVGSLLMVIIELMLPNKKAAFKTVFVLLVLSIAAWAVHSVRIDGDFLNGILHQNNVIRTFKYVFLAATGVTLLFPGSWGLRKRGEYFYLVLMITLGSFFLIQSNNLLLFYISLELISITSYVLITFSFSSKGFEAGIKYLLFGAMASGLMIYGMSLMYGLTGSLALDGLITDIIAQSAWINIATILFFVGILFKLALIPMHIWSPDAYEAGPSAVIALISTLPKVAVLLFMFHFVEIGNFDLLQYNWQAFLSAVAIGSLLIGNLSALRQDNIKRMMAYSSIAHSGILVIGLIVGTAFAYQAMLFYAVVYVLMNIGAFYFADWMEAEKIKDITELNGLGRKFPVVGVSMIVIMIALVGLPPTGGFSGKLLMFSSVWEQYAITSESYLLWLFVLGILNAGISLFYYMKIPYQLFIKERQGPYMAMVTPDRTIYLLVIAIVILAIFFRADSLFSLVF